MLVGAPPPGIWSRHIVCVARALTGDAGTLASRRVADRHAWSLRPTGSICSSTRSQAASGHIACGPGIFRTDDWRPGGRARVSSALQVCSRECRVSARPRPARRRWPRGRRPGAPSRLAPRAPAWRLADAHRDQDVVTAKAPRGNDAVDWTVGGDPEPVRAQQDGGGPVRRPRWTRAGSPQGVIARPSRTSASARLWNPRKRATNAVGGRVHNSSGEPSASTRPSRSTTVRSATRKRLFLVMRHVEHRDAQPSRRSPAARSAAGRAAPGPASPSARRASAAAAAARAPAPAPPAAARRPRAWRRARRSKPGSPTSSSTSATRARASLARRALHPQPERDVAADVAVREQREVLEHQPEAALVRRAPRQVLGRPSSTRPAVGRSSPATARSSVVLPQPLGPSRLTISPSATLEVDAVERRRARRSGRRPPLEPQHQKGSPARSAAQRARSARIDAAVSEHQDRRHGHRLAEVQVARAGSASGRWRRGSSGVSGRAMKSVAPNSPSETANANPAPTSDGARDDRQVDLAPDPARRGAEHRGRLAQARVDRAQDRHARRAPRTGSRRARARWGSAAATSRRSSGGWSSATRNPKPTVTAEVPERQHQRARRSRARASRAGSRRPAPTHQPPSVPAISSGRGREHRASCGSPRWAARTAPLVGAGAQSAWYDARP